MSGEWRDVLADEYAAKAERAARRLSECRDALLAERAARAERDARRLDVEVHDTERCLVTFTSDDIALDVEIPEIYDGVAIYLLRDGQMVNRFAGQNGWGNRAARVDEWIAAHGDSLRANNIGLIDRYSCDET